MSKCAKGNTKCIMEKKGHTGHSREHKTDYDVLKLNAFEQSCSHNARLMIEELPYSPDPLCRKFAIELEFHPLESELQKNKICCSANKSNELQRN